MSLTLDYDFKYSSGNGGARLQYQHLGAEAYSL